MTVHNAKSYKLAKIFIKDLTVVVKEVTLTITRLAPYIRYKPVARLLSHLKSELAILEAHKADCEKIVGSKGQIKSEGDT